MAQITKSNRNGGRPRLPPEWRTVRKTVTMPLEYWRYLELLDSNRSAAIRKVIDYNKMLEPAAAQPGRRSRGLTIRRPNKGVLT